MAVNPKGTHHNSTCARLPKDRLQDQRGREGGAPSTALGTENLVNVCGGDLCAEKGQTPSSLHPAWQASHT